MCVVNPNFVVCCYDVTLRFRCMEAVKAFEKLECEQYRTGWVLCQVARAHFEMINYTEVEPS